MTPMMKPWKPTTERRNMWITDATLDGQKDKKGRKISAGQDWPLLPEMP